MSNLYIREESKKILESKNFLIVFILYLATFLLPALFLYLEDIEEPIIFYSYNIFASNLKLIYPLISIYLYSWIIGHEYSYKTIHVLKNSSSNLNQIILSKFLSTTIIISSIYLVLNLIYLIILLFTSDINNIYVNGLNIEFKEFIINWFIVLFLSLLFIISIGSISMFLTFITKKWFFTTLLMIVTIILLPNIPLPNLIREHTPLSGFYIAQLFYIVDLDINYIIKTSVINFIFIILFLLFCFLKENKVKEKI